MSGISPQAEGDGDVEALAETLAEALPVTIAEMLPDGIPDMLTEGLPIPLTEALPEVEDGDPYGGNPSTGRWGQWRSPHGELPLVPFCGIPGTRE